MKKSVAILGAGPAGLALAVQLLRRKDLDIDVTILEKKPKAGGLALSFKTEGLVFDYGSHRLHPATDPIILNDIKSLLGDDLLERARNGRIRLLDRYVKFPFNPFEMVLKLPLWFPVNIFKDRVKKIFYGKFSRSPVSFADELLDGLGKTICDNFYFPYARKIWGFAPEKIAAVQARKRVSANTIGKMVYKILSVLPGLKSKGFGKFFYPRNGFGQISNAFSYEIERLGGTLLLSHTIRKIHFDIRFNKHIIFSSVGHDQSYNNELQADFIFSTIPINLLVKVIDSSPPEIILSASDNLKYRSMILVYLILETDQFTNYDAHYFPSKDVIFSRISEPKNYSGADLPDDHTGLCIEIPCKIGDKIWSSPIENITKRVIRDMDSVELPIDVTVKTSLVKRIKQAYPVYDLNYESRFKSIDNYLLNIPGLVTIGRQGLFTHDNTHHTIEMAYRANECLESDLTWNIDLWHRYRQQFNDHVVED